MTVDQPIWQAAPSTTVRQVCVWIDRLLMPALTRSVWSDSARRRDQAHRFKVRP